ncbi:BTAD domain-containing putative transcriptional regulator [Aeromicrobium sp.]|uniref:BTAD domain-containing putative transcriptional regulator n=1 Tax=Aeromicrobium sp. TaxID=1871063 RepID=UPI003C3FDE6F
MSFAVHLLGRPHIARSSGDAYQFRSRKSWAILAYLVLSDRPPSRSQLATLLFSEADDPIRALRWSLAEIRRAIGDEGSVDGDPIVLRLADDTVVDVDTVMRGAWAEAVDLPGLGSDLLEGMALRGAPVFETWLLSKQHHVAAASEAILHEAALGAMARGAIDQALDYGVRAAAMSPLDENHQALLIRLYRMDGDDVAANRQYAACHEMWGRELGTVPGAAVEAARQDPVAALPEAAEDEATIEAILEAGSAAIDVGATASGLTSLRLASRLADHAESGRLMVGARIALGEALIRSLRGQDEEGLTLIHEADEIATAHGLTDEMARARTELGYVDFLRGRYDRSEYWLNDALRLGPHPSIAVKATTYLAEGESDRAGYPRATRLLGEAIQLARSTGNIRAEAYALSMLGRIHLLRGSLETACHELDAAIELAERDHWLAFLPWPQALRGDAQLALGDPETASVALHQAFARACQLGDPCWEGISARGVALVAESAGDVELAFSTLSDARRRTNRLSDPYTWLDVHILDALCAVGVRHGHEQSTAWVTEMRGLASRTGMRELVVRSLVHGATLGNTEDLLTARLLAADIDNPVLDDLLDSVNP